MSIKSKGRRIGRMIRRITGIKLPIAMKIGKKIAQGKEARELMALFPEHVFPDPNPFACTCCLPETVLQGPKGSVEGYYISERLLEKELRVLERLAKVPFGTPVSAE